MVRCTAPGPAETAGGCSCVCVQVNAVVLTVVQDAPARQFLPLLHQIMSRIGGSGVDAG